MTETAEKCSAVGMANVLKEEKKQQVLALGRLGWPLRRIEKATQVRRETASAYLRAAGIAIRGSGRWGRGLPVEQAKEVVTDSGEAPKPANEVITDSAAVCDHRPSTAGLADETGCWSGGQCMRAVPRAD